MKILAYILILLSLALMVQAIEQEISGSADVSSPSRVSTRNIADKETQPEAYRNLMSYQWIRAILPGGLGISILYFLRRWDRLDPFSPEFKGNEELDKLNKNLDEKNPR